MDLLSDVLRDLRLESAVLSLAELRAPWGIDKGRVEGAPFHAVIDGYCWLEVDGHDPVRLEPGDLVVLPRGDRHGLMSEPGVSLTPFTRVLQANGVATPWRPGMRLEQANRIRFGGKGPLTRLVTGLFAFRDQRNPLLDALPPLIHVPGTIDREPSPIAGALKLLVDESFSGMPGFQTTAERLADVLFVQAVRHSISTSPANSAGWLRGLTDPQIAHALSLAHSRAGEMWTVASLAKAVGLSRTVFAKRFRALTGAAVMEYIGARRMHRAADLLASSHANLSAIANEVGYESEVSFSKAFHRWARMPPGQYRREMAHRKEGASQSLGSGL